MEYSFIGTIIVLCIIAFYFGRVASKWQDFGIVEDYKKRGQIALLKPIYIFVALFIGAHVLVLFFSLLGEILAIPTNKNVIDVRDLALAFIGSISAIGALFGVYLAILRSEENKRQNDVAEKQSETAIRQSETAIKQSETANEQNQIANDQNKIANEQNQIANEQREIANKQANTAEQGLISDRINKAVENLGKSENGNPVIEARIGAIFALERIAKDSERDHIPIMEIFCAYIRTNSSNDNNNVTTKPLREDIETILKIISRRHKWEQGENRLEIEKTQNMHFNFYNCYLKSAELYNANLFNTNFNKANLQGAWLNDADISKSRLVYTDLTNATLTGVKTSGAHMQHGDLSGCQTLIQEQLDQMFLGEDVKLPKGLNHPQKGTKYYKIYTTYDDFMNAYYEWLRETGN